MLFQFYAIYLFTFHEEILDFYINYINAIRV